MKKLLIFLIVSYSLKYSECLAQGNFTYDSDWINKTIDGGQVDNQSYGAALGKIDLAYRVVADGTLATITIELKGFEPNERFAYTVPNQNKRGYSLSELEKLGISKNNYQNEILKNFIVEKFINLSVIFDCNEGNQIRNLIGTMGTKIGDEWLGPFYLGKKYEIKLELKDFEQGKFFSCAKTKGVQLSTFDIYTFRQSFTSELINETLK